MEFRAVIIDDERHCTEILNWELSRHCPEVKVVGMAYSAQDGYNLIVEHRPDVVFLDIEMPVMNGFELLQKFDAVPFQVIFTTAYDQFAINAIRVSALDYLLKPINQAELREAVSKLGQQRLRDAERVQQMSLLMEQVNQKDQRTTRIAVPCSDGLEIIEMQHILYCKADSNYTEIHMAGRKRLVVARTLKQIEEMLDGHNFLRVHQSYLVNLDHVVKYVRGGGGYLILDDKTTVNVAQSKKEALIARIQGF